VHHHRFDVLIPALTHLPTRRDVLRGLAGASLGLVVLRSPDAGRARKKRKRKNKKPKLKRNAFGCVDVGGKCLGNDANCCSGICEGKKPKKGKKDTSVCVGHDTAGVCFPDSDTCTVGGTIPCGPGVRDCRCLLTTGNAGFCGDLEAGFTELCRDCARDADCEAEFGPGAACVFFHGICSVFCPATGRTACVPPCAL
jgi:hypothetical protein